MQRRAGAMNGAMADRPYRRYSTAVFLAAVVPAAICGELSLASGFASAGATAVLFLVSADSGTRRAGMPSGLYRRTANTGNSTD
jgi:hypothetical protein